eukprot:Awhi_evm1s9918
MRVDLFKGSSILFFQLRGLSLIEVGNSSFLNDIGVIDIERHPYTTKSLKHNTMIFVKRE